MISSLVAGGVAERGGELLPGDRLVFVNDKYLDSATLAEAVEVLKSVPPGTVSLGICKPLVVRTGFNFCLFNSVTCVDWIVVFGGGGIQGTSMYELENNKAAVHTPRDVQNFWLAQCPKGLTGNPTFSSFS